MAPTARSGPPGALIGGTPEVSDGTNALPDARDGTQSTTDGERQDRAGVVAGAAS